MIGNPLPVGHVLVDREFAVATLRRAVVFMYARWSAPCHVRLRGLADVPPPTPEPWFHVVDIDAVSPEWQIRELELSHGYGEMYWIRDGVIVHRLGRHGLGRFRDVRGLRDEVVRATAALFAP